MVSLENRTKIHTTRQMDLFGTLSARRKRPIRAQIGSIYICIYIYTYIYALHTPPKTPSSRAICIEPLQTQIRVLTLADCEWRAAAPESRAPRGECRWTKADAAVQQNNIAKKQTKKYQGRTQLKPSHIVNGRTHIYTHAHNKRDRHTLSLSLSVSLSLTHTHTHSHTHAHTHTFARTKEETSKLATLFEFCVPENPT